MTDNLVEASGIGGGATFQYLNKGYQAAAAPTGAGGPMTYAKGAVVWNTNIASGQSMGWACSASGSLYRSGTISGTGDVTGTTLTVTTVGNTYYLFAGAFIKIKNVQHQIKAVQSYNSSTGAGVYTLYTNNLGGDVSGATLAGSPPAWVTMPNYP